MARVSLPIRDYFWVFIGLLSLISLADFVDHLTRSNTSVFRDQWLDWLGFTVASTAMVLLVVLLGHLLGPRQGFSRFGLDLIAAALAPLVHVTLSGPLADHLFWTGQMSFSSISWTLLLPFSVVYGVARGATWISRWFWQRLPTRVSGTPATTRT